MKVSKVGTNAVIFEMPDGEFQILLSQKKPILAYWVGRKPTPSEWRNALKQTFAILKENK